MRFTFLHAADLHLGSPLLGLALKDAAIAARFASAGRDAFTALVDAAIEAEVAFVLVAGDVYDGDWKDSSTGLFFAREVGRLDRKGIPLFLIRGNHDAENVMTRSIGLPGNVRELSPRRAETVRLEALGVAIHGRGFADRSTSDNLAAGYPPAVAGWFNIGMLHSSLDGRPGHASYAPCSVDDLLARGYDYWALGHVHAHEEIRRDPWIVFPGNIQGRSVRECGPKGVVMVEVTDRTVASVRRLVTDRARWADLTVDVAGAADEAEVLARIEAALGPVVAEAQGRLVAARIRVTGATAAHGRLAADPERMRDEMLAAAQRVHEDVWLERVVMETTDPAAAPAGVDLGMLDLCALVAGLDGDPAFRERVATELAVVQAKLPASRDGRPPLVEEHDALVARATALLLGRAAGAGR